MINLNSINDITFAKKLGYRIRDLRKLQNISQLDLAYDIGMSMNTISGIELGKISPKIETLKKIADKLSIDIGELFAFSEYNYKNKYTRKQIELISQKLIDCDAEFIDLVSDSIDIMIKVYNKAESKKIKK